MIYDLFKIIYCTLKFVIGQIVSYFNKTQLSMDITEHNLNDFLPEIKEAVDNATFLTIDCELTGLNTVHNINAFDTMKRYYEKVRGNSKEFLVIQYGLSAFRYDAINNVFKQSSYNFYIFRRPVNKDVPDQRFLCQASSIDFLISQGFNFNKLFKEGISYLNTAEESKFLENIEERKKIRANNSSNSNENRIAIPETDQPFIDTIVLKIKKFLENDDIDELQLPRCNPFLRKLIYQTTSDIFGNRINLETKQMENKDRVLFVRKSRTMEEFKKLENRKVEEELKHLDKSLGFTKVLRMIVESGKLVVGHNMLLDLLHTIDKFLTPLPFDYEEFKSCAHTLFPNILDTKYMCSQEPFKDLIASSVLGHLVDTVRRPPFSIPKIEIEGLNRGYTIDDKKEHEAAYDAYITGLSFISMWGYLGQQHKKSTEETFRNFDLLESYLNRIFLMRLQDNAFMRLGAIDPVPPRDHVFHFTFPKEWKLSDIQQFFSPFGNIYVSWIDGTSAYVGLNKRDQAALAYSVLSKDVVCKVTPFAHHQMLLARQEEDTNALSLDKTAPWQDLLSEDQTSKKRKMDQTEMSSSSRESHPAIGEDRKKEHKSPKAHLRRKPKTFSENTSWD